MTTFPATPKASAASPRNGLGSVTPRGLRRPARTAGGVLIGSLTKWPRRSCDIAEALAASPHHLSNECVVLASIAKLMRAIE